MKIELALKLNKFALKLFPTPLFELALMQIDLASKLNRSIWASRHGVLPLKVNDLALMEIE